MEKNLSALILSGVGGLYTLCREEQNPDLPATFTCRGKGAFRHADTKLLVGDRVTVRYDDAAPLDTAVIRDILPRKCALIRPPMANVTHLFLVVAAAKPAPVTETMDKLLAIATHHCILPTVVITKSDLDKENADRLAKIYTLAGFSVVITSVEEEQAHLPIQSALNNLPKGSIACFAGASGVGKSTLLNRLLPSLSLTTGEVSRRIERGRHTTRRVDLYDIGGAESPREVYIADTPGFSLLDFAHFDFFALDDLFDSYPDFAPYFGKCRYGDCTHTGEGPSECAIAKAVEQGEISPSRHASYVTLYRTLKTKENTY